MNKVLQSIKEFLADHFNLKDDQADESVIIDSIRKNIEFKGVNLWTLIFAIFIASIGLNVNSTAVIIGAMLISPIMGPIMGVGLGIGINDLELVKKGARSLLLATLIGIITSAIYFSITPLHEAQSELLARTSPSVWDVFIALFGGLAGMVAASRKEKTNVIPGVAIATALIPPLCTAGYGLAIGNWYYVLGALYLYFINSVFIAIATYLISRYLKITKKQFEDIKVEKRVTYYMIIIVIITFLPSIFLAYKIVNKNIFESNAQKFIEEQFVFPNTQVVTKSFVYNNPDKSINVLLFGEQLSKNKIASLNKDLTKYNLKDTKLSIVQGLNARKQIDLNQIKTSILQEVYAKEANGDTTHQINKKVAVPPASEKILSPDSAVLKELKVLYPNIQNFGVGKMIIHHINKSATDTVEMAIAGFKPKFSPKKTHKLQSLLRARYQSDNLKLVVQ
ncbi:TIGR00341 family protein [Mucilaginibacter arboris]|uniref:TIGR00341 family protein n=1 Tax=Mucilaginibacter arboris TaxID=2682090 RepID=A0A7K1SZU7_9SPHI|nr:TIGR00341 family protein [Mucilaginibacter arboris]MVN22844.1 TIGR00341 family protein [Mucilaginibacter arboris]